jgi:hypothetical protein
MLKFSPANAKTKKLNDIPALSKFLRNSRKVYSLDILSGWSCPFANECLSKVHTIDGKKKVVDGKNTKFRCFSASQEAIYTNVYKARHYNYQLLKQTKNMYKLLNDSLPKNIGICRIHVAGDFFNADYFKAWLSLALEHSDTLFYAYTKSLPYILPYYKALPNNFVLTASYGGRCDNLIEKHGIRSATVVYSQIEADLLQLEIDHDDSHAANPLTKHQDFALLIHGIQPKGSEASVALRKLKGTGSYSR